MGRSSAEEMMSMLKQDQALRCHLQYNHYPPVHEVFIPVAKEAIDRGNQEDWDHVIEMPNGRKLAVAQIIEELHLEFFLEELEGGENSL